VPVHPLGRNQPLGSIALGLVPIAEVLRLSFSGIGRRVPESARPQY